MKEQYIKYAKKNINGEILEVVLKQIDLFFNTNVISNHKYDIGNLVELKKGTFIHGIQGDLDSFDWVLEKGFISSNFTDNPKPNKFFNSVGMWNIKEDKLLKNYIQEYSGITLGYYLDNKRFTELVPYGNVENKISLINHDEKIWSWHAEQTKEIRFLPSLDSEKVQIAFILNMESEDAKTMKKADIFTKDDLQYFIIDNCLDDFVNNEADAFTTDREAAIMFGLPTNFIEGILVGRKFENNMLKLNYIKQKLPNAYICNLDGIVILK